MSRIDFDVAHLLAGTLVLISFLPLLDVLHYPVVGFVALAIILATLVARVPLPRGASTRFPSCLSPSGTA